MKITMETTKECFRYLFLCLLMFANVIYMHYEVYLLHYHADVVARPLFYSMMDVLFILLFFTVITFGKRKAAFIITYSSLMLIVLANIIYSRYFEQYITFAILGEYSNFEGSWWFSYFLEAFRWSDLMLLVSTALFVVLVRSLRHCSFTRSVLSVIAAMLLTFAVYFVPGSREDYVSIRSGKEIAHWIKRLAIDEDMVNYFRYDQERTIYQNGILRAQLYCNVVNHTRSQSLSASEKSRIDDYLFDRSVKTASLNDSCVVKGTPNIIFLLVESYLSVASQVSVGGYEITPTLNRLMREEGTYSNLIMRSQKGSGESSDAQVSYFTGFVPMRSELSISYILQDSIAGFPALLRDQKGYHTYITLPTPGYFWHQKEVNLKYGIDDIIECVTDDGEWFNDEMLFAKLHEQSFEQPYLNVVLTISMHGTYGEDFLGSIGMTSPFHYPESYSPEFCHYLDKCYYTDLQIGKYLDYLKRTGAYDNSVIIITSDHETITNSLNMEVNDKDLPLIMVNSGIPTHLFTTTSINQIDLYPTMLDMFGIESEWRGLGRSILRDGYSPDLTTETLEVSDMMLRGNYFAQ